MKSTWSELIDRLKRDKAYASESEITNAQITDAMADTQNELAQVFYESDPDMFGTYLDITAAASASLPSNLRKVQYVEWRNDSSSPWVPVKQMPLSDREGLNDSTNTPTDGTFRVNYTRLCPYPNYGTLSAATSTTVTLPATPTYGLTAYENDYYNGAMLRIVSGTGVGQIAEITDYAGSTRVATVTFTTTPSTDSVYNIEAEIPEDYVRDGIINGTLYRLTRDDDAGQRFYQTMTRMRSMGKRSAQTPMAMSPFEIYPQTSYSWYLRGNTIYFYET